MSKVRNKDSQIEIEFRKELWKEGFRYGKNSAKYFGKPDLVLPKYETVIFIDSCFWHGCRRHGSTPKTRGSFWRTKIERNKERDTEVSKYYKKLGIPSILILDENFGVFQEHSRAVVNLLRKYQFHF